MSFQCRMWERVSACMQGPRGEGKKSVQNKGGIRVICSLNVYMCRVCHSNYSIDQFSVVETGKSDNEISIKEALHIKYKKPSLNNQLFTQGSSFVLNIFWKVNPNIVVCWSNVLFDDVWMNCNTCIVVPAYFLSFCHLLCFLEKDPCGLKYIELYTFNMKFLVAFLLIFNYCSSLPKL